MAKKIISIISFVLLLSSCVPRYIIHDLEDKRAAGDYKAFYFDNSCEEVYDAMEFIFRNSSNIWINQLYYDYSFTKEWFPEEKRLLVVLFASSLFGIWLTPVNESKARMEYVIGWSPFLVHDKYSKGIATVKMGSSLPLTVALKTGSTMLCLDH